MSKLLTAMFIFKAGAFAVLDWLDSHRFVVVLFVFFSSLALLMWSFTLGPVSPPSPQLDSPTNSYPYVFLNIIS